MIPTKQEILDQVFKFCIETNKDFSHISSPEERISGSLKFNPQSFDNLARKVELFYFNNGKFITGDLRDKLYRGQLIELIEYIHYVLSNQTIQKNIPITQIMKILPHELGIIMVDVVEEVCPDLDPPRIKAVKNVSSDAWWAQKHFPGNPTMLGNFILEGLCQTAGILAAIKNDKFSVTGWVTGYNGKIRFKQQVVPGDVLRYHAEISRYRLGTFVFNAWAEVRGVRAVEKFEILLSTPRK